ncbi:MAG: 4Fe-4S dicluster domain-containing protein [Proteobacteria bacterium]|nr:4Fe-4S dicluster domain-containing protein [Pseudomonadota bacterium]MBU4297131.1 4Fe-4S dicluster domain-containing protein [Pseudomonadota bacterium]MCG2746553.1 4Fe-4S dicluster domain-containing protein [Desulfobulbaceae bacterium]
MDQPQLRTLEATCIQEESPQCSAACPIHIDVRAFMGCLAKEDWRGARRVLDRTMPFADIVGRICDEPCRIACKRAEIGDPLAVGSLERFCVSTVPMVLKQPKLPAKGGSVAVIGSGLSAMTAALDLARKGRNVVMMTGDEEVGGSLRGYAEEILPARVLSGAVETLDSYGVNIQFGCSLNKEFFDIVRQDSDAVFFDRDCAGLAALSIDCTHPDPLTLAVGNDGCFAGGGTTENGFSIMKQVEDGRRASLSIERYLQKVSLTAQREREGSCQTRLHTVTIGIEPLKEVLPADPAAGFTKQEAAREASRCIQCECKECVKQCAFLQEFTDYPKRVARKIYNNQAIVQGTRTANKMINSCMLCGQCTVICPHDFPMAEVCRTTRENMVAKSTMPPSAHEFALQDMEFSLGEFSAMARHQPGLDSSRYLFYPGCQLAGSAPETVEQTYLHLTRHLDGGVGLMLGCCGIPAQWSGRQELFGQTMQTFQTEVRKLGDPLIITACSSCYAVFKEFAPELEVQSLWQILDKGELPEQKTAPPQQLLTIHDPCTVRHEPEIRASVRSILKKIGIATAEQPYSGELTDCCGYGGLMQFANVPLGEKASRAKGLRSDLDGLAYCAMCRDNLAASGRRIAHLLDYLFPAGGQEDPLLRPNPGFSGRHENRARLKQHLLTTLWQEEPTMPPEYKDIKLFIDAQVMVLMNKRHILEDDLQKVIFQAEQSGRRLIDPENGHFLASFKPVRVTYWVEYQPDKQGFVIHNAYSHRMILPGDVK